MCFRPGNVEKPIICVECNNRVPIVAGYRPTTCPKCGADLPTEEEEGQAGAAGAVVPPSAPVAPAAPAAPAAPTAPAAPAE